MEILKWINYIIAAAFFVCYAYQFFYILVPHCKKPQPHKPAVQHRYAVLICARNEERVIGDLIASLRRQTYDPHCMTVFVMADNCTDCTACVARRAGAMVYERFNMKLIGKGYALNALLSHIAEDYPGKFDGYFVFDADNVLRPDYIEQMNRVFSDGYDIVTSYRNSKNYGTNWISAGYALWFLRESKYLNHARMLLHTSCAVSGTGFLFSQKVLDEQGFWPFHLLTEDIVFSVHHILQGYKIGFAADAVLYDEQPTTFRQSWTQRLRWAKGYLQVVRSYGRKLFLGISHGSFSCYDMSMNILPAFFLTLMSVVINFALSTLTLLRGGGLWAAMLPMFQTLGSMYLTLFLIGIITTATQWKQIHTTAPRKLLYACTFPLFMFSYVPISATALVTNVGWEPITHSVSAASLPADMLQ